MKKELTKEEFVGLMYRNFGDDIDDSTWEDIFDEMAEEYSIIVCGDGNDDGVGDAW